MLADTLGRIWAALDDLGVEVPEDLKAVTDAQSTCILLGLIRGVRKELQTIEGYVEHIAAERMEDGTLEGPGVHAIRRRTAERTEWKHEDLASAVLVSALVDENGELPDEAVNVAATRVKQAIVDCAGFSYWRVGKLAERNIDVSDFRVRTPGRYTVEVTLGDAA